METGFKCQKIQTHYWQIFLQIEKKKVLKRYFLNKNEFNLQDRVNKAANIKGHLQAMETANRLQEIFNSMRQIN